MAYTQGDLALEVDVGSFDRVVLLVIVIEAFPLASVVTWNEKDQKLFIARGVRMSSIRSLAHSALPLECLILDLSLLNLSFTHD